MNVTYLHYRAKPLYNTAIETMKFILLVSNPCYLLLKFIPKYIEKVE